MSGSNGTTRRVPFPDDQPWNDEEVSFLRSWGADLVTNAYLSREAFVSKMMDPRRNYYDECGYPRPGRETDQDFYDLYRRDSLAARVVEVFPKECWQVPPEVYETEDDEATEFETAFDETCKGLRGEFSWARGEAGTNPLWQYLQLADVLSGVGSYGVILLGFDDVKDDQGLRKPVKRAKYGGRKLLSVRAFTSVQAEIVRWDTDPTSPRRGMPEAYNVTFNDFRDTSGHVSAPGTQTVEVHWTRCVHVVDRYHQAVSSEWAGAPRLRPVLNEVLGDQKVCMTSPEAFWRACVNLLMIETHPTLGGDVKINESALKNMMERIMNGMERYGVLRGLTAKSVAPTVNDPKPHHDVQLERISIKTGIPLRILKGSERGELSSAQDSGEWNARCAHRNSTYTSPGIVFPVTDRLIWAGVLPEPGEDGYSCWWPDRESSTRMEKATMGLTRVQALAAAVQGNVAALTGEHHLLTTVLGYEEREAESMIKEAEQYQQDVQEEELAAQEAAIDRGLAPDPALDQAQGTAKFDREMNPPPEVAE